MKADAFEELKKLVYELSKSKIREAYVKSGSAALSLKFGDMTSGTIVQNSKHLASDDYFTSDPGIIASPGMGYFRLQHPFITESVKTESVVIGQVIAYLQFEEVLIEVVSDRAGLLSPPLIDENSVVGYGDALFTVS